MWMRGERPDSTTDRYKALVSSYLDRIPGCETAPRNLYMYISLVVQKEGSWHCMSFHAVCATAENVCSGRPIHHGAAPFEADGIQNRIEASRSDVMLWGAKGPYGCNTALDMFPTRLYSDRWGNNNTGKEILYQFSRGPS